MELSDYNRTFVHIKCTGNILVDAISRLKMLEIYTAPLDNPKAVTLSNTEECTAEVVGNKVQSLSTDRLYAKQKKDTKCRNLAPQLHHKSRKSLNTVMLYTDGLL